MEKALIEKASRPTPPEPRRRSGEAYVGINLAATKSWIDRPRGRRSKEATQRRYSRRAAQRMIAKIKAEKYIGT